MSFKVLILLLICGLETTNLFLLLPVQTFPTGTIRLTLPMNTIALDERDVTCVRTTFQLTA